MAGNSERIKNQSTIDHIKSTQVWEDLKSALVSKDSKQAEELLHSLLFTMERMKDDYEKLTVEIRKDTIKKVRIFCARHNYTLKVVMNVALESIVNIGLPDETTP